MIMQNNLNSKLLSRDDFREGIFKRDKFKCVFCNQPAIDAHHILERRLFTDGGYYLDNGASVCEFHHLECEKTNISVEDVRSACGITNKLIPEHFYSDVVYDKWGNIVLPNGTRLKGELFFDESVQKILKQSPNFDTFTNYVKYPRTYHLPWSGNVTEDDRVCKSLDSFQGRRIIVTNKLDGENSSLYKDYIHARSLDGRNHPSRDWLKNFWASISNDIPEGYRICGENMKAVHSIRYLNLKSYFYGFSIWNEKNICLSWDETIEWFNLLGIEPVPVLYDGIFDENIIKSFNDRNWKDYEGYVVRLADAFTYSSFRYSTAKYVRDSHVQTVNHWMHQMYEENKLQ